MAVHSIIKKSELESAQRLDAQFYQPQYLIDFSSGKWVSIGDILETAQYGLSLVMNEEGIGYPIFKMDDIRDAFLVEDSVKSVDITEDTFKKYQLQKNDVLFNRVNSEEFVGRTGISKLEGDYTFASYLIRLKVEKDSDITPDYLNIFLNSKYGQRQIDRYKRRAVNQANVNAQELQQFKIAVISKKSQDEVSQLSNQSWNEKQKSKSLYQEAEHLLLKELGLEDFEPEEVEEVSNVVKLSEIKEAGRLDAEYFQNKYEKLIEKIMSHNAVGLVNLGKRVKGSIKNIKDKNYRYTEISDIEIGTGEVSYTERVGENLPANAKIKVSGGEIIISKVRPTRGAVAIIPDAWSNDHIASGAFSVFQINEVPTEYLQIILRSAIGKLQMERPTTGTSYPTITDLDVENLLIPILPKGKQKEIAGLVRKSHEARKRSRELLNEAIQKVEQLIESNNQ